MSTDESANDELARLVINHINEHGEVHLTLVLIPDTPGNVYHRIDHRRGLSPLCGQSGQMYAHPLEEVIASAHRPCRRCNATARRRMLRHVT